MENGQCKPVSASRQIDARAGDIFKLLADPAATPNWMAQGCCSQVLAMRSLLVWGTCSS